MIPQLLVTDERAAKWQRWTLAHIEHVLTDRKLRLIRDLLVDRQVLLGKLAEHQPIEGEMESGEESW